MNNPFIRYKIYSTDIDKSIDQFPIDENVKVLCLITSRDMERKTFLQKILSAAKIEESNYHIITLDENISISAANQNWLKKDAHILCFGIPASKLNINIPRSNYKVSVLLNTKIIQLPGLETIESDKNEKQLLWELMKKEFLHE